MVNASRWGSSGGQKMNGLGRTGSSGGQNENGAGRVGYACGGTVWASGTPRWEVGIVSEKVGHTENEDRDRWRRKSDI